MKKQSFRLLLLGILAAVFILVMSSFHPSEAAVRNLYLSENGDDFKSQALEILESKCNICHKKQNPFMVFKEKNMEKRANNIYRMVFLERRMPKGDEIRLTNEEYFTLEKWLKTQDIY